MARLNDPQDVANVSVTTSATALITTTVHALKHRAGGVFIQPADTIYIGGPSVTTTTGIKITADQIVWLPTDTGRQWYAIAGGTVAVRVLPVL